MDDFQLYVGKPGDGKEYTVLIDDVIFFADDPDLPPEKEPFPNRVIFLAAFDTGIDAKSKPKYWPGEFEIVHAGKERRRDRMAAWRGPCRAARGRENGFACKSIRRGRSASERSCGCAITSRVHRR